MEIDEGAGTVRWISIDDGYPKEDGVYLCHFSDGTIETFDFSEESEAYHLWGVHNVLVTHWMPLPDPPNKTPGPLAQSGGENEK